MPLYHWKGYLLFILLTLHTVDSAATNFSQCFTDVVSCAKSTSSQDCPVLNISNEIALDLLRTSNGTSVHTVDGTDDVTALSYSACQQHCGRTQEPFAWPIFSQQYAQWLLPYLALLSQLPFGARRRKDNLMSVILTLGSPTLAGYSLYVTFLNARWVNDQLFSGIDYPSAAVRQSVVRVLSSLQQVPLRIHPGSSAQFESLVVHPDNDEWWNTLAKELDYSHTWSISSATSITWVVIAYLLTVADSLSNVADNINSKGQGTGSVWLWLLPIVVGWLVLSPKCDYDRVQDAYDKANRQAFVADSQHPNAAPTLVTTGFGLTISPSPDWQRYHRNITCSDESRIPPVFNYARTLLWSRNVYVASLYYRAAWRKSIRRLAVDGGEIPGHTRNDVPRESRLGNREQIINYCTPDCYERPGVDVLFPRGVFLNMLVASFMALLMQWGTTFSAVLAAWFSPTIGLGCRSLSYIIYGTVSTLVWILLLSSSVLAYYARHHADDLRVDEQPAQTTGITGSNPAPSALAGSVTISLYEVSPPSVTAALLSTNNPPNVSKVEYLHREQMDTSTLVRIADWLRWIGKLLAIVNSVGIIAISIFQFANVFDNCYCNSSVFYWGSRAFIVISPNYGDIALARQAWIGALALGLICCGVFVGVIYLVRDSLPS